LTGAITLSHAQNMSLDSITVVATQDGGKGDPLTLSQSLSVKHRGACRRR
jgi:hypothetical protein